MAPEATPVESLGAGEVGYIVTGLKDVAKLRVGDTLTTQAHPASEPLPGYKDVKPMVFAALFPTDSDEYPQLRDALERLRLNDASLSYEPETSQALGFGFRCGFLGLLHMEIVRERLEREFDLDLLVTAPTVAYKVTTAAGDVVEVHNPADMPPEREQVDEPYVRASIVVPKDRVGQVMELCNDRRAVTAPTALILARVFGNSPDFWLNVQRRTDLWQALHSPKERQRIERAPRLRLAVEVERERKALEFRRTRSGAVGRHQHAVADPECGMHDLVLVAGRATAVGRVRAVPVAHQHVDLRAECLPVEVDRLFAATIEEQIRLDLHGKLLSLGLPPMRVGSARVDLVAQALFLFAQLGCEFGAEVLGFEHRPDFDVAVARHRIGTAPCPLDRFFHRVHLP